MPGSKAQMQTPKHVSITVAQDSAQPRLPGVMEDLRAHQVCWMRHVRPGAEGRACPRVALYAFVHVGA